MHDYAFALQNALLRGVLAPSLLTRMRESESRTTDAYRLSEHFDRLTKAIWGEVGGLPGAAKALEGPSTRRELQRSYVDQLATMIVAPPAGAPDDARGLARLQLQRIDGRCARTLLAPGLGDNTRAHLGETRARIKRALEAGAQVN